MSRFWSTVVHGLTPYVPGEQPKLANLVKLNTNENPYGPGPKVLEALRAEATDALRLYPDPGSDRLRQAIAARHGVALEQVFVGNGSDEVLAHAFLALLKHEAPVLFPDITYSFYTVYCRLYGIGYREVPLTPALEIRVDDYLQPCGGIIFPNPNAPTGRAIGVGDIERLLQAQPGAVVVVDEAYVNFGTESAVPLVSRHPNLLVIHTLSKARSLAGLRVGYAIGDRGLIEGLNRVKDSFNSYPLDRFAQAGGAAALEDEAYFEATWRKVMDSRQRLVAALEAIGFEVVPSAANFIFARHPAFAGAELAQRLRERGIVVRHFGKPARIADYLRITVGTQDQCDLLASALGQIVAAAAPRSRSTAAHN
jgi:histidinol-phosphate aminotransferase